MQKKVRTIYYGEKLNKKTVRAYVLNYLFLIQNRLTVAFSDEFPTNYLQLRIIHGNFLLTV